MLKHICWGFAVIFAILAVVFYVISIKEVNAGDLGKIQVANIQSTVFAAACALACIINVVGGIIITNVDIWLEVLPDRIKNKIQE